MRAVVTACLAAVAAEPDKVLKLLARYRRPATARWGQRLRKGTVTGRRPT
jgi:hypothetical protein